MQQNPVFAIVYSNSSVLTAPSKRNRIEKRRTCFYVREKHETSMLIFCDMADNKKAVQYPKQEMYFLGVRSGTQDIHQNEISVN